MTASTYTPEPGQRAVGVEAVLFNDTSAAALDIGPLNFTVIGSDDLPYAPLEGSCDSQFGTSRLAQGESTHGTLVFALPAGVQVKSLRFKPTSSDTFIETSTGAE